LVASQSIASAPERRGRPAPLAARLGPAGFYAGVERDCIALGGEHPGVLDALAITPPDQAMEPRSAAGAVRYAPC
jgi:hypothetical protein